MMKSNVIWIDENIDNQEKSQYIDELKSIGSLKVRKFKNVEKSINYMKYIEFEETKVIVSGKLYNEYVKLFTANIIDICVVPKVIVFTHNKKHFIDTNPDYKKDSNKFYNFCGVHDSFKDIKQFVKNEIKIDIINKDDNAQLTFEPIDTKEKLVLPLFFKALIDNVSNDKMEKYTSRLYEEYKKDNNVEKLLSLIQSIPNIPIELLSKYYARLYTIESDFYKNINEDLGKKTIEKYLPFIKTLYEGVKLKSLPLATNNKLYRGSKISNDEIKKIKKYFGGEKKNLLTSIVFSNSFLSVSLIIF